MTGERLARIDDWSDPWLPLPARAWNHVDPTLAAHLVPLDEASLLRAARRRTGLADFGGDDFRAPLRMLLRDLNADPCLTPLGRVVARSVLGQVLTTRLCIAHELAEMGTRPLAPVRAPIVVVGLPRTGTTHLHNLLSRAPALRFLPMWQSVMPFRAPGLRRRLPDLRRVHSTLRLQILDRLMPLLRTMHEMDTDLPHEELQLCAPALRSFFFESSFRLPTYQPWYASRQHPEAYAYLQRALALVQRDDPTRRWVLKSPQHLDQFGELLAAFPDAVIVRTHRDPARAVLSLITMLLYARRACYRDTDVAADARHWVARLEQMLRDSLAAQAPVAEERIIDVEFDAFVADPTGTAARVLEFAGVEVDRRTRAALDAYHRANPRDRHGRIEYDFASIGLDEGEVRERLGFYRDRIGVERDDAHRAVHAG
jgi:hypothetical protein